jgi:hypothetical protein
MRVTKSKVKPQISTLDIFLELQLSSISRQTLSKRREIKSRVFLFDKGAEAGYSVSMRSVFTFLKDAALQTV